MGIVAARMQKERVQYIYNNNNNNDDDDNDEIIEMMG